MGRKRPSELVREYDQRYPDALSDDSQKQERMERLHFKEERQSLRRTGRNRGVVIPPLPWERGGDQ